MNKAYREDENPKNVICEVYTYPENFQKFVMRYYEDTFGAPGDLEGS